MENFNTIFEKLDLQYGLDIDETDAIDIGLIAWRKIGNLNYKLHRFIGKVKKDGSVELPCNCPNDGIEAVTYPFEDWQYTSVNEINGDWNSAIIEHYIEGRKRLTDPFYTHGRFVKYELGPGVLYIRDRIPFVSILYKGPLVDDEGLPYINDKEAEAIACYIAYTEKFKQGWKTNNEKILQAAQLLEQRWLKLCSAAKVRYLNQNDMNEILDVKSSYNRHLFGKSLKPIR